MVGGIKEKLSKGFHLLQAVRQEKKHDKKGTIAVSYTALITLNWLARSGNKDAEKILQYLSDDILKLDHEIEDYKRITKTNIFYQMLRYDSLNCYAEKNGYKTVIDIACGFSPRGLHMSSQKVNYVGCDFEQVVKDMSSITGNIAGRHQKKYLNYRFANVLDADMFIKATEGLTGPVCIMTEGLSVYLDTEQNKKLLQNIKIILDKYDGCFITQDYSTKEFVSGVATALYGEDGEKIFMESKDVYAGISDDDMERTFLSEEELLGFISEIGLSAERVPLFDDDYKPEHYARLDETQLSAMKQFTKSKYMWVIESVK